jgi:hypothetical protein
VYGLNAVFALSSTLRTRVQNCIEARGGAIERAAIVSALIGGRSVKSALALARKSFRAIRMDALCAADLASNDAASSARLHALSTPMQYGEVDVLALQRPRLYSYSHLFIFAFARCSPPRSSPCTGLRLAQLVG